METSGRNTPREQMHPVISCRSNVRAREWPLSKSKLENAGEKWPQVHKVHVIFRMYSGSWLTRQASVGEVLVGSWAGLHQIPLNSGDNLSPVHFYFFANTNLGAHAMLALPGSPSWISNKLGAEPLAWAIPPCLTVSPLAAWSRTQELVAGGAPVAASIAEVEHVLTKLCDARKFLSRKRAWQTTPLLISGTSENSLTDHYRTQQASTAVLDSNSDPKAARSLRLSSKPCLRKAK